MRSISYLICTLLLTLFLAIQTDAALATPKLSYVLKSAKLALSTVDGSSRLSKEFSTHSDYTQNTSPFDLSTPTQLENDDIIRLTFQLAVEESGSKKEGSGLGKEHVPHQAFVVLAAEGEAGKAHAWPLSVKPATGKATWNLRMDRLPTTLLRTTTPLKLSLLLANFPSSSASEGSYSPLSLPLLILSPPQNLVEAALSSPSLTPREQAEISQGFLGLPEHKHTFGISPADTMPSRKISALASLVTAVVPWIFLLGALGMIKPEVQTPTTKAMVLFAALAGLEGLAVRYWVGLTLFQMLPWLIGGGLVTVVVGRTALVELRRRRVGVSS